jgi:DNA-directed RNA polymerase specialized sigma24 family protein
MMDGTPGTPAGARQEDFAAFVRAVEPRLHRALVAAYGPADGREATVDALSWAWEHWDRLPSIEHPVAYLFRVGQSARRRFSGRPSPQGMTPLAPTELPDVEPGLVPALGRLSLQQRTAVLLVHAFGWSQTEVAALLDVNVSTVREHIARGMDRLRRELEACGVG